VPYIEDGLMEVGDWQVELDYDPALVTWDADDWLAVAPDGRPYVHVEVYEGERLIAPPLPLLRREGDERGFVIGGPGLEWWQGGTEVAPLIEYREFISGANRLINPDFAFDLAYWALAEGTAWRHYNVGGLTGIRLVGNPVRDDVIVYDRTTDVRAGQQWRVAANVFRVGGGAGRLRVRGVFTGRFTHPDLLLYGGFESATGWTVGAYSAIEAGVHRSGTKALRIGPIPHPEMSADPEMSGAGWLGVDGLPFVVDGVTGDTVLRCLPIPYPQLLLNPDLELGPGHPWAVPLTGDIGFINNSTKAHSGNWYIKVGPNVQKQILLKTNFETAGNWFASSELATPDTSIYYLDPGGGMEGSQAITHAGIAGGPEHLYLRADFSEGTAGVQAFPVVPGEEYLFESHLRAAPNADGIAYISLHLPHETLLGHERWVPSSNIDLADLSENNPDTWQRLTVGPYSIPDSRVLMNVLLELHKNHNGYVAWDNVTVTRVRGNRDRMESIVYPVEANSDYRLSAHVNSDSDQQVGRMTLGGTLSGPDVEDDSRSVNQGHTDFQWEWVKFEFTPVDGQTGFKPWLAGEDIAGAGYVVDDILLHKISNNSRETIGTPFAVTPEQSYLLSADLRSDASVTRGTATFGLRFSGPGLADNFTPVDVSFTGGEIVNQTSEVAPPPGYTLAQQVVRFTDVEGGNFDMFRFSVTQADNNKDVTTGASFPVTPERTYSCVGSVRSEVEVTRGRVALDMRLTAAGRPDQLIPLAVVEGTDGVWTLSPTDFSPPSGYGNAALIITGVDIDGGRFHLDDFTVIDSDASTSVFDVVSDVAYPGAAFVEMERTATAPTGAETVHIELVAEQYGYGWMATAASLSRAGVTPASHADVIRALLLDPDTGEEMSVRAGNITASGVIPADWEVINRPTREAMREFATTVASPPLEWWTDVDGRQHWGPVESLFVDHMPGTEDEFVVLARDLYVRDLTPPRDDAENRASKVKLIGSERPKVSGGTSKLTAIAVDATAGRDLNGRPINRTLLVEDSGLDLQAPADARAATVLAENRQPTRTVEVVLSETRTYPPTRPGNWIYPWKPSAGLVDRAGIPVETSEGVVFPKRMRILGRRRELGSGYRIVLRKGPGQRMELPHDMVRWGRNATTLTLGERRPSDVTTDASGRPAGDALLRLRASAPGVRSA
jgi:hypothetical protein